MKFVYQPNHPESNENGMVDIRLVEYHQYKGHDPHFSVISDTMEPLRHMATGKMHTSKASFRADTKAAGCIELGTDSSLTKPRQRVPLDRGQRRDAIKRSIYELRNGRKP
jgi:hypothetical protein